MRISFDLQAAEVARYETSGISWGENMIRMADLAWLAGLMEGEGTFSCNSARGSRSRELTGHLYVSVGLVDEDVILKVRRILGFGTFRKPRRLPSGKTFYVWTIKTQHEAAGLMMTLLPFMGTRRAQAIRKALDAWKAKPLPKSRWTHCIHGHPLSGDNLYVHVENGYTKRRCRKCIAQRQKVYLRRLKLISSPKLL